MRGNRSRMIMGFHFHQNMRRFLDVIILMGFGITNKYLRCRTFHHRGVVAVGGQNALRIFIMGITNHRKQRFSLLFAVNSPAGIEDFVAAMLGVGLGQRQTQTGIGPDQRIAAMLNYRNRFQRQRLMFGKQIQLLTIGDYLLRHTVMQ